MARTQSAAPTPSRRRRRSRRQLRLRPAAGSAATELDRLVHERVRLGILSALAASDERLVQRPQGPARRDRRQRQRPRAQARGGRLRRLHEVVRRAGAAHRVPHHRRRARRARPLPRPHGSAHPRRPRPASATALAGRVRTFLVHGGGSLVSLNFVAQSTSQAAPFHVAMIMDGNGRWATRRGLPRAAGHRAGARSGPPHRRGGARRSASPC